MSKRKIAKNIEKILIEMGIFQKPRPGEKPKDHTKSIIRDLEVDDKIKSMLKKR